MVVGVVKVQIKVERIRKKVEATIVDQAPIHVSVLVGEDFPLTQVMLKCEKLQ